MATTSIVPTMSTSGYVSDTNTKFDFLISDFFTSDYNQTAVYPGYVSSVQRILQDSGNNVASVISSLNNKLTTYLNRYFTYVNVSVIDNTPKSDSASVSLTITVKLDDDGSSYVFERLFEYSGTKIENIAKINNYGT